MPTFVPSPPSQRNLAVGKLTGSSSYVIRDVTDINQATTVATLNVSSYVLPRFVGPTEVSYVAGDACPYLVRANFVSNTSASVTFGPPLYDWSPDGTVLTYFSGDAQHSQLRQIAGGVDRALSDVPPFPQVGCESLSCADNWQIKLSYSPDGRMIFLSYLVDFSIRSNAGTVIYDAGSASTATWGVWSGNDLYFRDHSGVEVWRSGSGVSAVAKGVSWIEPRASPGGGLIVFTVRDSSGLPRVRLLNTSTGAISDVAAGADTPEFLTSRYLWYRGMRLCTAADSCAISPDTPTGRTYIYDLATDSVFDSKITDLEDTWPHAA